MWTINQLLWNKGPGINNRTVCYINTIAHAKFYLIISKIFTDAVDKC